MRFGIAFKLGCLMALFGMLPTALAGYYIYNSSRELLLQAAERDLQTAVQVLGRNLLGSLHNISLDAAVLTNGPQVKRLGSLSDPVQRNHVQDDLAESFRAMLLAHPDYMQIRLISATDHGLEWVRQDRDGKHLVRVSGADLQEKGHYAYVFETLRLAPGEVRISPIVINHEQGAHSGLGKPTLHVSTPVADVNGKVFALLVINVDLDQLFSQLQGDLPSEYQVYLGNRWGDLLIHPDHRRTFGFDQGRRLFLQDEFPGVAQLLSAEGPGNLISRSVEQDQQDGLVAAFVRLSNNNQSSEPFVVLGLGQLQSHVLAQASRAGGDIARIALFFSLLALLVAFIASRALIRPLRHMTEAVELFSRERKISELTPRHDELGLLARSFWSMKQEILTQLEDLTHSRAAFEHLARHDSLTGLPNRRMCFERLEQALAVARKNDQKIALLFVDLDHFKEVNDQWGHRFGDQVLQAVAKLLSSASPASDSVARLGGDEFVIFFEDVQDSQKIVALLEKLHLCLQLPLLIEGKAVEIHASMGVSMFPRDGSDIGALIQHADHAMYKAKSSGRNRYSFEVMS
ncbi:diguanylate cyclase domain-containing protein [Pseudomonas sp. PD9R]|uniref:diguanylate cyclase domain-containing protein n=1 Tax=Pseudomonas sp. PD9R TaxID=2853534 RepID=UPI001C4757BB|nr:diguanylate cyclase [Pseudomonas sp. PD9R]MBV6822677.1 diguanylate cyclase [Pseudomonas sp. PD9R]